MAALGPGLRRGKFYVKRQFNAPLDESITPNRNPGLTVAQNVVYRRFATVAKRTGTAPYGASFTSSAIVSGVRWYRGVPSVTKQMIVQTADGKLWLGNDGSGAMTNIYTLPSGATPAFFAAANDPAESGVTGTPESDILIITYGSGPPLKWDGTNMTQLSSTITNDFTGCTAWHNHVWFWGDPNNPDTVFATDLGNPEGFTFSTTYGGYQIGQGDGDALVQCCIGNGGALYVFKAKSIWAITGFDFYTGNYQFQLTPVISGVGTSAPFSVQVLRTQIIFWSGQTFYRLAQGSITLEPLGLPLVVTSAAIAQQPQSVIRATAGDFLIQGVNGYFSYTGLYLCAVSTGSGVADHIMVYDDDASQFYGRPAWSQWTGLTVGAFIPWGGAGDQQLLYIADGAGNGVVDLLGGNATADGGGSTAIAVSITTGRDNGGSDETKKHMTAVYVDVESNALEFNVSIISDLQTSNTSTQSFDPGIAVGVVGSAVVGTAIVGPALFTLSQTDPAPVEPSLDGHNFQFTVSESSTTSAWELQALSYLVQEETLIR